jgi:hypothetical protein
MSRFVVFHNSAAAIPPRGTTLPRPLVRMRLDPKGLGAVSDSGTAGSPPPHSALHPTSVPAAKPLRRRSTGTPPLAHSLDGPPREAAHPLCQVFSSHHHTPCPDPAMVLRRHAPVATPLPQFAKKLGIFTSDDALEQRFFIDVRFLESREETSQSIHGRRHASREPQAPREFKFPSNIARSAGSGPRRSRLSH